jgi:hypothetical protein
VPAALQYDPARASPLPDALPQHGSHARGPGPKPHIAIYIASLLEDLLARSGEVNCFVQEPVDRVLSMKDGFAFECVVPSWDLH